MAETESNPEFISGVPEFLILRLLSDREMYGYEIVRAIRARTEDEIAFGEGVVYPVLHALVRRGALVSQRKPVNGRSRVYYALTPVGAGRLAQLQSSWQRVVTAVQKVLEGDDHVSAVS